MKTDDGGPAFSLADDRTSPWPGMTLRDYFAASIMAALCTGPTNTNRTDRQKAADAYRMADAMIQARNQETK